MPPITRELPLSLEAKIRMDIFGGKNLSLFFNKKPDKLISNTQSNPLCEHHIAMNVLSCLNSQRIDFSKLIGSGRFGNVYPYQKSPEDERWVVKIQHSSSSQLPQKIQEVVLGFSCDHPNVLPIKGFHIDFKEDKKNWELYIKMPRMTGSLLSKLKDNIKEQKYFSDKEIIRYFYNVACGLTYLHKRKIVHRDIKPDNILLHKNGSAIISDVGLGRLIEDQTSYLTQERAGAISYLAPEILEAEGPLKREAFYKADVWSMGIAIAELCLLKTSFLKFHLSGEQKEAQVVEQLESVRGRYKDSSFIDLVLMLLKHNPEKRISAEQVKRKLEENYGDLLGIESRKTSQGGEFLEENKCSELTTRGSCNVTEGETVSDLNAWRDKMTEIKNELEKSKNEFLEFKQERLQVLIQEMENSKIFNLDGEKQFTYKLSTDNHLTGILIKPKDTSKISDEEVKQLVQGFTTKLNQYNWKQLELLYIDLANCKKITDNALPELSVRIATRLAGLKFLRFDFHNCQNLTDRGVIYLAAQIGNNLKALESVQIYLTRCQYITDNGAQQLVSQIANNLKNLKQLHLNFGGCNISSTTINELVKYLPNQLQNLMQLNIYLYCCSNITENSFIQLINQIALSLRNLEAFELDVSACNISDEVIYQLAKHFENGFKNIKHPGLYFSNCTKIKDKSVLELVRRIVSKNIQTLKFGLSNCVQISDLTGRSICLMVENNLRTLQILYLGLNKVPLTDETKKLLKESLNYIPKLVLEF